MMGNIVFYFVNMKKLETIKILMYVLCIITHNLTTLVIYCPCRPSSYGFDSGLYAEKSSGVEIVSLSAESLNTEKIHNGQ